jgi:cell division protein FtsN
MAQRNSSRKPRSSGASRRGGAKKGGGVPGWVWLVTGVLMGLFAAFLVFLGRFDSPTATPSADKDKTAKESVAQKEQQKKAATKESPASSAKATPSTKTTTESAKEKVADAKPVTGTNKPAEQKEKPAVNYDFYKILPQYEVVVPEEDPRKPANTASNSPGTYYLQVGAFRQMQEADSRKAGLAMLGIVSSIQTVTVDPGNTWHRVRIGPVKDMRQLDRTKKQLQENNISFVTLKEKS